MTLVDLRDLRGVDLLPLFQDQVGHWQTHYWWDFRPAIPTLCSLLDRQLLEGRALVYAGRPAGYAYFIPYGSRAVLGDLFVSAQCGAAATQSLLQETLNAACRMRGIERIEGQLLCLEHMPGVQPCVQGVLQAFPRILMLNGFPHDVPPPQADGDGMQFLPWSERYLELAAELVAASYRGHVDALISVEFASVQAARDALRRSFRPTTIGETHRPLGIAARKSDSRDLAGLCLCKLVSRSVGHISQLCVAPRSRGCGLGTELLRRAVRAFAQEERAAVSLTVTESNLSAVRLYRQHGFKPIASFPAFTWVRT